MARRNPSASGTKTPPERSAKAHVARPPKKLTPHTDAPEAEGRHAGQYTGQGNPGLQKK